MLIFAPYIEIEDGFEGNVQAFARDSLVVGRNCQLQYPSVLGLMKMQSGFFQPFIHVGEKSLVQGVLFSYQEVIDREQTVIRLEKGTFIEGMVYADGYAEIKGWFMEMLPPANCC